MLTVSMFRMWSQSLEEATHYFLMLLTKHFVGTQFHAIVHIVVNARFFLLLEYNSSYAMYMQPIERPPAVKN